MDVIQAIELAVDSTESLARRLPEGATPYASQGGSVISGARHGVNPVPWTQAFWIGRLRAIESVSGSEIVRRRRQYEQDRLTRSLREDLRSFNHDLGFLGILAFAGDEATRGDLADEALTLARQGLAARVHAPSGAIDAHGASRSSTASVIVDSLMNSPLLGSGSQEQRALAKAHNEVVIHTFRTAPGHWYQGVRFGPDGGMLEPFTIQGRDAHSTTWSRGIAWAHYGLQVAEQIGITPNIDLHAELSLIEDKLLGQDMPLWDLSAKPTEPQAPDSSAAAIVWAAKAQLGRLPDPDRTMLQALSSSGCIETDATCGGLLRHASYHVPDGVGVDEHTAWGDYFYLEALLSGAGWSSPYVCL